MTSPTPPRAPRGDELSARIALVDAVRGTIGRLATSAADDAVRTEARRLVGQASALLAGGPHRSGQVRILDGVLGLAQAP